MDDDQVRAATPLLMEKLTDFHEHLSKSEKEIFVEILDAADNAMGELQHCRFANKLHSFMISLPESERALLKQILYSAMSTLSSDTATEYNAGSKKNAFGILLRMFSIGKTPGKLWFGRPDFITDELFSLLQSEAEQRRLNAEREMRAWNSPGGEVANRLAKATELRNLLDQLGTTLEHSGETCFLYYDEPGSGVDPHYDRDEYSVNVLICIQHKGPERGSSSCFQMYDADGRLETLSMQPREMLVFNAGCTFHGRENVRADESVVNLTMGFRAAQTE